MIRIYCAQHCEDENDEVTRLSGCAFILEYIAEAGRGVTRKLAFALGSSSAELSKIQCLRVALSSIKPGHRSYNTIVYVDNDYVIDVLSGTIDVGDDCKEAADKLRLWFSFYTNLRITSENNNSDYNAEVRQLAIHAAQTQEHMDTTEPAASSIETP